MKRLLAIALLLTVAVVGTVRADYVAQSWISAFGNITGAGHYNEVKGTAADTVYPPLSVFAGVRWFGLAFRGDSVNDSLPDLSAYLDFKCNRFGGSWVNWKVAGIGAGDSIIPLDGWSLPDTCLTQVSLLPPYSLYLGLYGDSVRIRIIGLRAFQSSWNDSIAIITKK
jgi:hypothetical protein